MERVCYMYKLRKSHELIVDCLTWNYRNRASSNEALPRRSLSCRNSSETRKSDEDIYSSPMLKNTHSAT